MIATQLYQFFRETFKKRIFEVKQITSKSLKIGAPDIWYHVSGIIGKYYWWDFKLANFNTVWRETHTCNTNGLIMA